MLLTLSESHCSMWITGGYHKRVSSDSKVIRGQTKIKMCSTQSDVGGHLVPSEIREELQRMN